MQISVILGMSFVPYIDWAAHVGGLIGGIFAGLWMFGGRCERPLKRFMVRYGGLLAFVACTAGGLAYLFLVTQPPKELLAFCSEVVKPSFPSYNLQCYGN